MGQVAHPAGMIRPGFLDALGEHRIPIYYDAADVESGLQTLKVLESDSRANTN